MWAQSSARWINQQQRKNRPNGGSQKTQCRVDTRPGQCGASSLQGGNHTFTHSETVRDLPVRRAQGAGVRISKGWKRQVIYRPQETRLQNKRVGARLSASGISAVGRVPLALTRFLMKVLITCSHRYVPGCWDRH